MKNDQDVERALRDWLTDGPTTFSNRAFASMLAEVHATPQQRRRRRVLALPRLANPFRLAFIVAVAVAAVALAFALLRPPSDLPAIGSPQPAPLGSLALGPLAAGTYTSVQVVPHVTFTVPPGLLLRGERPDDLWLATGYPIDAPEFDVIRTDEAGALERLAADKRITASAPVAVTVTGLPARSIDVSAAAGAYPTVGRNTLATDAVIVASQANWYIYLTPGSRGRVIELTVGSSHVLIFYQAPAGTYDSFAGTAEQLIASLVFPH
jgi:hypothetical protein